MKTSCEVCKKRKEKNRLTMIKWREKNRKYFNAYHREYKRKRLDKKDIPKPNK